jgi:hypothetical protein
MDPTSFELNVSIPGDPRYASALGALAKHAARYAGFTEQDASRFALGIERIVRASLKQGDSAPVPVIIRREGDALEFLIASSVKADVGPVGADERQLMRTWLTVGGRQMLCLSRLVPRER